jgi:hypothetical protein
MATSAHGGGEEHLVRKVNVWVVAAGYSGPDDLFLSTASLAPSVTHSRCHATEDLVNSLAREIGSRAAPDQGFSSQSFKVGAVSELSATGAGPSAVAAFTGHKTASALMHYNRKRMNCEVPTLMAVTADGANYTREDASLEWASSSVSFPIWAPQRGVALGGSPHTQVPQGMAPWGSRGTRVANTPPALSRSQLRPIRAWSQRRW